VGRPVEHPEQRASDAERESVVQVLARGVADGLLTLDEFAEQSTVAYEARTRGELDLALGDLPVANPLAPLPPPPPVLDVTAHPAGVKPKRKWVVAIMGGEERRGRWRDGRRTAAVALMGGVKLDLRDADLDGPDIQITAWAVMGGVDVIVPEGVVVEDSGFMLMGGRTKRVKPRDPEPGAPVVHVKAYGLWGGVTITSRPAGPRPRQGERPSVSRHGAALPSVGGLTSVVCTDIVGSTRLADELGDQRWRDVLGVHNRMVREQLAVHGGAEVKQLGDGFLAVFASARMAARFGVGLQQALADYRRGHADVPLQVRVGIHAGDVERDGNDIVGRNVHVASRLCDVAGAREILATEVVCHNAGPRVGERIEPAGALRLRGISERVAVGKVRWRETDPEAAAELAPEPERRIDVVVADDQQLVRAGFRVILDAEPDIRVVGEAADGRAAIDIVARTRPDVVLMDIRMPELDGLEAAERILSMPKLRTAVLMLTTFDRDEYIYRALQIGASGFLLKDAPADRLLDAVRVAASGDALLAPSVTRRLIEQFTRGPRPAPDALPEGLAELTERELEVLRLVARGLSNAEIAAELVLGENTVKTHVAHMLRKLGLRDRVQAVVLAYETGVVGSDARHPRE
jgi:DNA-binding NarL/FixJ family response regulator/class 3 adenylate cyclase